LTWSHLDVWKLNENQWESRRKDSHLIIFKFDTLPHRLVFCRSSSVFTKHPDCLSCAGWMWDWMWFVSHAANQSFDQWLIGSRLTWFCINACEISPQPVKCYIWHANVTCALFGLLKTSLDAASGSVADVWQCKLEDLPREHYSPVWIE